MILKVSGSAPKLCVFLLFVDLKVLAWFCSFVALELGVTMGGDMALQTPLHREKCYYQITQALNKDWSGISFAFRS